MKYVILIGYIVSCLLHLCLIWWNKCCLSFIILKPRNDWVIYTFKSLNLFLFFFTTTMDTQHNVFIINNSVVLCFLLCFNCQFNSYLQHMCISLFFFFVCSCSSSQTCSFHTMCPIIGFHRLKTALCPATLIKILQACHFFWIPLTPNIVSVWTSIISLQVGADAVHGCCPTELGSKSLRNKLFSNCVQIWTKIKTCKMF